MNSYNSKNKMKKNVVMRSKSLFGLCCICGNILNNAKFNCLLKRISSIKLDRSKDSNLSFIIYNIHSSIFSTFVFCKTIDLI